MKYHIDPLLTIKKYYVKHAKNFDFSKSLFETFSSLIMFPWTASSPNFGYQNSFNAKGEEGVVYDLILKYRFSPKLTCWKSKSLELDL